MSPLLQLQGVDSSSISVALHRHCISITLPDRPRAGEEEPSLQEVGRDEREKRGEKGNVRIDEAK